MTDIPYNEKYPNMRVTKDTMTNLRWIKAATGESYLAIMNRLVAQELQSLGITPPATQHKETKAMTYKQALKILVNGTDDSDKRYEAVQVVELAVLGASVFGDPDRSLQDWISAGSYKLTDTPETIAAEWDGDRD